MLLFDNKPIQPAAASLTRFQMEGEIQVAPGHVDFVAQLPSETHQTLTDLFVDPIPFESRGRDVRLVLLGASDMDICSVVSGWIHRNQAWIQIVDRIMNFSKGGTRPWVDGLGVLRDRNLGHTIFFATLDWKELDTLRDSLGLPGLGLAILLGSTTQISCFDGSRSLLDIEGPKVPSVRFL